MDISNVTIHVTQAPAQAASYAIPIGVITAAGIAGLFSLVTLIISKENKVTEFRQAWIDAQRNDLADLVAAATALIASPLDNRAENLATFDRCHAKILLRDNPHPSVKREYAYVSGFKLRFPSKGRWLPWEWTTRTDPALPWSGVTDAMEALREELSKARFDTDAIKTKRDTIIQESRLLLKGEWGIVKDGERWFALTRRAAGSFVVTSAFLFVSAILIQAYFVLSPGAVAFGKWLWAGVTSWFDWSC